MGAEFTGDMEIPRECKPCHGEGRLGTAGNIQLVCETCGGLGIVLTVWPCIEFTA